MLIDRGRALKHTKATASLVAGIALLGCSVRVNADTLEHLLAISDTVVIATPIKTSERLDSALVDLAVREWLVGTPNPAPVAIVGVWSGRSMGTRPFAFQVPRVAGIWFLKSRRDGAYDVNPVRGPKTMPPRDLYFPIADSATCQGPLASRRATAAIERISLEFACLAQFQKQGERVETNLLQLGPGLESSAALGDAFRYLAQHPGSRQRVIGISGLLLRGEPLAMLMLERELSGLTEEDLGWAFIATWRNPNVEAIHALGRMATNPRAKSGFQYGATLSLVGIHTAATLPYLARLLDSTDRKVRERALTGFVFFVNGNPIETPENYRSGEFMKPSKTPYSDDESWKPYMVHNPTDAQLDAAATYWKNWLRTHSELPQVDSIPPGPK